MAYPYQIRTMQQYQRARQDSLADPEAFWADLAKHFTWMRPWDRVLDWNFNEPSVRWFDGAQLNITENCLDRHLAASAGKPALIFEPNDPNDEPQVLSYGELHFRVVQFARVLKNNGVQKGDRVCLYMGMIPELAIALLACARIGAVHSVVFAGFSAQSLADRINDAQAKVVITCDGANRGAKVIPLKSVVDQAAEGCTSLRTILVVAHCQIPVDMVQGRDLWLHDEIDRVQAMGNPEVEPEVMEAEDLLFILYTSGSTGQPKGVVHTCAGYMVWAAYTFVNAFQYQQGQVHFCTADLGWITGHSYLLYGPLLAGGTTVMFEGVPTWPDAGRFWDIVDRHQVNILYTAPTAIRSLMGFGLDPLNGKLLDSLKVLGTVGEPINEEAWTWYHSHIGKGESPIVDTWWQTETGGIMITNLAGVTPAKPTFATLPMPGIDPVLVDEHGSEIHGNGVSGNLCIRAPWPGMLRTTYGDHERCRQTYFSAYPGLYFTGDGCLRDEDGHYRITGRVDDVLNVSGHRIGTAEVENALSMHAGVVESAVVGFPHGIKGQGIYAYVVYQGDHEDENRTRQAIAATVSRIIGPIAKPDQIQFVSGLPKTRSGKIMRRILRKIAEGDLSNFGDTTTLLDPSVVDEIASGRVI
ncbi:MAG: acetate--CoA ligase [Cryomorphaceae bacterium]|nr:acetate--CoA ligase [Cryomorphaceae bacterium]